jgi:hypothetical protein
MLRLLSRFLRAPFQFSKRTRPARRAESLGRFEVDELMSAFEGKADFAPTWADVRFSNRPVRVKRFRTIHQNSFEVTRGLVLLYGIGT